MLKNSFIACVIPSIEFVQKTGKDRGTWVDVLHLVLTGNPGTGKTTTARLIARYLKAFGIITNTDNFAKSMDCI